MPGVSDDYLSRDMDTLVLRLPHSSDTQFLTDYLDVCGKKRKASKNRS